TLLPYTTLFRSTPVSEFSVNSNLISFRDILLQDFCRFSKSNQIVPLSVFHSFALCIGVIIACGKSYAGFYSAILESYHFHIFSCASDKTYFVSRSEEHTSELQSRENLVCRLLLEKKKLN